MSSSTKNDGDMKKFMFDKNDFDKAKVVKAMAETFTEEQLKLARDQAFAQGKAEGVNEATARQEEALNAILEKAGAQMAAMATEGEQRELQAMTDAARLALRVIEKILPQLSKDAGIGEIERVITETLDNRKDEPRIAISVPLQHLEALKARTDTVAAEKGFAGKMILIADDNLGPTDCRVEWADGGAERLYDRLFMQIESEFSKALSGMQSMLDDKKD